MIPFILCLIVTAEKPIGTFNVSAYCSCPRCCGRWSDGKTASGTKARWGVVAADWRVLPKGTRLRIHGIKGVCVVEDKGGAIKGRRLDIWFPSHEAALKFGRRRLKVWKLQRKGRK